MHRFLLATAALAALAGCRENAELANNVATETAAPAAQSSPLGAPVSGEEAKKLMHDRHEGMEDIGDATKAISRTLKEGDGDAAILSKSGNTIADLAHKASGWFPPGTGPDVGKTRAKAVIWKKPDDFAAKMKAFQAAADKFLAMQKTGSVAADRQNFAELGKTCKACHDDYRAPED